MTLPPAPEPPGPPGLVALLDVLLVLLLFLLVSGQLGRRQAPVRLPDSRFLNECLRGRPRMVLTVHHGAADACGPYRRGQRCLEPAHWHLSAEDVPFDDAHALALALNDGRRRVFLRADAGAPVGVVQTALGACTEAGIPSVEVAARRQWAPR